MNFSVVEKEVNRDTSTVVVCSFSFSLVNTGIVNTGLLIQVFVNTS